MPPRCATRHKLGIQTYKGREARQSARLFEQAAYSARSLGKAAPLGPGVRGYLDPIAAATATTSATRAVPRGFAA
jgi:hypothetical protein